MPISENLKYWQAIKHVTTAELAEKSGVPDTTITKIRTRVTKNPNMDTLQRLAKALDVSINDLTDTPSVEDAEIRDLLPPKLPSDPEELVGVICAALRNQHAAADRNMLELRKDRNHWRKMCITLLSVVLPVMLITMILTAIIYWDLSHPGQGNIVLNYAMSAYK